LCKEIGADHVIDYSKSGVVAEVLKLTNNEGVDLVVDTTYVTSSFDQSASVVKKGGIWTCVGNSWADQHKTARAKCEERGAKAQLADFGRYWVLPEYIAQAPVHIPYMLAACDQLYASGVGVKVTKTIPFVLEKVQEEVLAVGTGKRSGKVVVEIAGNK
jgi:NADPH:quinone reductase